MTLSTMLNEIHSTCMCHVFHGSVFPYIFETSVEHLWSFYKNISLSMLDLPSRGFRAWKGQKLLTPFIFSPSAPRKGTVLLAMDAKIEIMIHLSLGSSVRVFPTGCGTQSRPFKIVVVRVSSYLGQSPVLAKKGNDSVENRLYFMSRCPYLCERLLLFIW